MLKTQLLLLLSLLSYSLSCGDRQPGVADVRFNKPTVDHSRFTAPCASCHEESRLPPTIDLDANRVSLTVVHGLGKSCGECHAYVAGAPSWKPIARAHGKDTTCFGCHTLVGEGNKHEPRGDCVSCHAFPVWKP